MTEIKIFISSVDLPVISYIRLDLAVNPELIIPVIKTSITNTIISSLDDFISLNYLISSEVDGILINVVDGKRIVETSLSREDSLALLNKQLKNGCTSTIFLEAPPIQD